MSRYCVGANGSNNAYGLGAESQRKAPHTHRSSSIEPSRHGSSVIDFLIIDNQISPSSSSSSTGLPNVIESRLCSDSGSFNLSDKGSLIHAVCVTNCNAFPRLPHTCAGHRVPCRGHDIGLDSPIKFSMTVLHSMCACLYFMMSTS